MKPVLIQGASVLLIEDEPMLLLSLADHMADRGFVVHTAEDGQTGLDIFRRERPQLVTLDLRMAPMDGLSVLAAIREEDRSTPVVIISGQGQMEDVIRALRYGASDYIQKPITDMTILDHAVDRALERSALQRDNALLSRSFLADGPQTPEDFAEILTANRRLRDIIRYSEAIAQTGEPVLITGETGVGKELLARALHRSSRRAGPFLAVNVAGLDEQAFSDTLFGHVRGAFTGADKSRDGFMERAGGGTLLLDEVGELGSQAQIRLLRVLQEREFHPLGSDTARPLRARILAATNRSPEELLGGEGLRVDFFFRLSTHSLNIPPLRERPEDILLLWRHFLAQAALEQGRLVPDCSPELESLLLTHGFPGNVRELKSMAHDALSRHCGGRLEPYCLPRLRQPGGQDAPAVAWSFGDGPLPTIRTALDALVDEALNRAGGVQKCAAAMLGISPQALSERLRRQGARRRGPQEEG